MLVIPLAWRIAPYLNMVDTPDESRKVHSRPIPRVGGWGIAAGTLLPICVTQQLDPLLKSYVLGGVILFVYGMWDDARQAGHWFKFTGQAMAAGLVVFYGDLYVVDWPFIGDALPVLWAKIFTVIALMGMVNAINHSDGLDGLAGGESILSLIVIAYLGYLCTNELTVGMALATMGGILGFLRYNTHPARVFMGDAGSQFLGFTLGFLAILLTQVAMPSISSASPLLFLGLPIADILAVLYKRAKGKLNWFKATRNHVHHRLLDLGFDHYETVVVIYSVQALLVTLAVLLRFESDYLVGGTYLVVVSTLFVALGVAESHGWRRRTFGVSVFTNLAQTLRANDKIRRVPLAMISILLPVSLMAGALSATKVPRDFGVVAGVIGLIVAIEVLFNRAPDTVINRLAVYVAAIFSSYLFVEFHPGPRFGSFEIAAFVVTLLLAIAVAVYIRYTSEEKFGATPTDYLFVFGVIALVVFGGIDIRARETVQMVMFSIVLLYAYEAVLSMAQKRWNAISVSTVVCLLTLAIRGLA